MQGASLLIPQSCRCNPGRYRTLDCVLAREKLAKVTDVAACSFEHVFVIAIE